MSVKIRPAARILTAALLWALGGGALAQAQVSGVEVGKMRIYQQNSATALSPAQFHMNATLYGSGLDAIPAPVLTGPSAGPRTMAYASYNAWVFTATYPTPAQLDASFPNGPYAVAANGASYSFSLGGDAYPNAPIFTLSGGEWVGGTYFIDPAQPLSVTTNAFTGFGSGADASVHVYLGPGEVTPNLFDYWALRSSSPTANSASLTIPAGTMRAGSQYYLAASFRTHSDVRAGPPSLYAYHGAVTNLTVKAERPQVFPLTVSSNITPTTSSATATFQPRPQDAGTTQSVYVFAVAPSTLVANAAAVKREGLAWKARGAKADAPVQCVLAQLNASGQLQAVSAAGLTAFVTSTLAASGQSIKILDNVATPNIAGTAFYVGYGTSAQQMIASGVNQRALDVAGNVSCDPRPPQTGWWFNPAEGGRGFSIEPRGTRLFVAAFHYEPDGRAMWNFAGGSTSVDGSLFTADFMGASGGQALTGAYRLPTLATAGSITFAFSDATHGTMIWPGGTVAIERQASVPNGLALPPQQGLPESGWWWNPQESGRGFFMEWQGGSVNIAGYMYDEQGRPTWYITVLPTPDPLRITGNWWTYAGGQAMGQPYRAPTRTSDNAGALDVQFTSATTATLRLPDGRTIPLVRQAF
jgi:hypothetical protein